MILIPLDQKLGELTHKTFNYSKKSTLIFFKIVSAKLPIDEGRPFTFCENIFGKPYQRVNKVILQCSRQYGSAREPRKP